MAPNPNYVMGLAESPISINVLQDSLFAVISDYTRESPTIKKKKGLNSLCATLMAFGGEVVTWGISMEELRGRSLASANKKAFKGEVSGAAKGRLLGEASAKQGSCYPDDSGVAVGSERKHR